MPIQPALKNSLTVKKYPTQKRLHELFTYQPDTGFFIRNVRASNFDAGSIAGCVKQDNRNKAYRVIKVDGKGYFAHRLVFLYVFGEMPRCVDHLNGNGDDNRFSNLKPSTPAENLRNKRQSPKNTSGVTGVSFSKKMNMWRAQIGVASKTIHIGWFASFSDAVAARKKEEVAHGYARGHGLPRPAYSKGQVLTMTLKPRAQRLILLAKRAGDLEFYAYVDGNINRANHFLRKMNALTKLAYQAQHGA